MNKKELQKTSHQDIWELLHAISGVLENNNTDDRLIKKDMIGHILICHNEILGKLTDEIYNHLSEVRARKY